MRPLFALLLVGLILGSLTLFFRLQEGQSVASAPRELKRAAGRFDLEITLTFDAGPDVFALSAHDAPAIIVEFRGAEILRRTETIDAGTPIVIKDVAGITSGDNSIYVRCTPKQPDANVSRAVRVRILRDGEEVAAHSLWSAPGAAAEGLVELTVPARRGGDDGDQDPQPTDDKYSSSAAEPDGATMPDGAKIFRAGYATGDSGQPRRGPSTRQRKADFNRPQHRPRRG